MITALTVLHPKGGVGRSTAVYMLGAELAVRGHRVALIDRDQGQHLSRIFELYPPGIHGLALGDRDDVNVRIIDTAPEVDSARARAYLREADWAIGRRTGPGAAAALVALLVARTRTRDYSSSSGMSASPSKIATSGTVTPAMLTTSLTRVGSLAPGAHSSTTGSA